MTRNDLENKCFKIISIIGLEASDDVFDPQQGRRRRARLRDKLIHCNQKRRRGLMQGARYQETRGAKHLHGGQGLTLPCF